ncbi:MAG: hypothetical protein HKM89_11635 [Gemmatimonadales bacterium]|nr:hypothetical protein [Gemmatimonadales bacterium]
MYELSTVSRMSLYILLALIGILTLAIWWAQTGVLRGKAFKNPDGSVDDWHEQKIFFGISFADVFLACPVSVTGIALVFLSPQWGYYLLALVSFWFLWTNTMTTVTSLRFEKPKITVTWFIVYPLGSIVGLAYIVWTLVHFDSIYRP